MKNEGIKNAKFLKNALFAIGSNRIKQCLAIVVFLFTIAGVYFLNELFYIDYGFWGCMTPAFASIFRKSHENTFVLGEKLDNRVIHILMLCICLIMVSYVFGGIQHYSLLAIPLLMLYSGERGNYKLKHFFYIFYPAHLVILEVISYF